MIVAPKRRWFRFSLRGLLVVVTAAAMLCGWAVLQLNWIGERRRALDWLEASTDSWYAPSLVGARRQASAPWSLRPFGERAIVGIGIDREQFIAGRVPYSQMELQRLFPEARVDWSRDGIYEDEWRIRARTGDVALPR